MASVPEGILLGMGNPLLDMSATVTEDYLNKYDLKANDAILADEKHLPIYNELSEKFEVECIPGGATQSAIKVAQWVLQKPHATTFIGCIKDDKFGQILDENCKKIGVNTRYQINAGSEPTGTCAVLLTGHHRSLVTNLGAANCYKQEHIEDPANWKLVEAAKFYYISGFFLTVSPSTMIKVAEHAQANKKTFCMNLSAPFLCQFFKDPMMQVMPYVDILIGNETEATTFAEVHNLGTTDVASIAQHLANLPRSQPDAPPRTVIITQGTQPTVMATAGSSSPPQTFPIIVLPGDRIVDTNGAGDAFAGGFLAQLVQGKALAECIRCGLWAGSVVVQRSGCTFPETPDFV